MRKLYGYTMTLVRNKQALGIPDQNEAKVVTFIYESYIQGHSIGGIVKLLQEKENRSNVDKSKGNNSRKSTYYTSKKKVS